MVDQTGSQRSGPFLFDHHRRELEQESGIGPDVHAERRCESIGRDPNTRTDGREWLRAHDFPSWVMREHYYFPMLRLPLWGPDGRVYGYQVKPARPIPGPNGKPRKYAFPKGHRNVIDVHPRWSADRGRDDPALLPYVQDIRTPIFFVEGIKKADALTSLGLCTIGMIGVYGWKDRMRGIVPELERIPLKGREATVVVDADARSKRDVADATRRLGAVLRSKGATVRYFVTPADRSGRETKGVDDWLVAGGTLDELLALRELAAPRVPDTDDLFTDVGMAAALAEPVCASRFCYSQALGWLAWDGMRWTRTKDVPIVRAVGDYVIERFHAAVDRHNAKEAGAGEEVDQWRRFLSAARVEAVTRLLRSHVEVPGIDAFDAHPDLLNTRSGVVDLTTGELLPHDPDLLMTRVTGARYVPGAEHRDWKTALEAVPEETADWLQLRFGQATTGHPPPDDVLPFLKGGGSNGKTTWLGPILSTLGDYAVMVNDRLLIGEAAKGGPEVMVLRGARLGVMEEIPGGKTLDTSRLKKLLGKATITGRHLYQEEVNFQASHALVMSSNHEVSINDTDHGSWRRVALVTFPYRYRRPGESLGRPDDRTGDPGLRPRLEAGSDGQHDAVLAWLVAGAIRWYARDRAMPALPEQIEADSRRWREESDPVLRFLAVTVTYDDPDAYVVASDLTAAYRAFLEAEGIRKTSRMCARELREFSEYPGTVAFDVSMRHTEKGPAGPYVARSDGTAAVQFQNWKAGALARVVRGVGFVYPE